MADFKPAYEKTLGNEGGYTNDPDDVGGETYKGIARNYDKSWDGWVLVDDHKSEPNFPKNLDNDPVLQELVRDCYKTKYWDVNLLDQFPQRTAEEMFDTGVNMGTGRAAKFLQRALSYLNRNGSLFPDLVDDGIVGSKTITALNQIVGGGDEEILLKMLNVQQGQHYMDYMKKSPTQEKYARGWFKRVSL